MYYFELLYELVPRKLFSLRSFLIHKNIIRKFTDYLLLHFHLMLVTGLWWLCKCVYDTDKNFIIVTMWLPVESNDGGCCCLLCVVGGPGLLAEG